MRIDEHPLWESQAHFFESYCPQCRAEFVGEAYVVICVVGLTPDILCLPCAQQFFRDCSSACERSIADLLKPPGPLYVRFRSGGAVEVFGMVM